MKPVSSSSSETTKNSWHFLLDEAAWMNKDFEAERKNKLRLARRVNRGIKHYWAEKHASKLREERDVERDQRRVAQDVAKLVLFCWKDLNKLVKYKQKKQLEKEHGDLMGLQLQNIILQCRGKSATVAQELSSHPTMTTTTTAEERPPPPPPRIVSSGKSNHSPNRKHETKNERRVTRSQSRETRSRHSQPNNKKSSAGISKHDDRDDGDANYAENSSSSSSDDEQTLEQEEGTAQSDTAVMESDQLAKQEADHTLDDLIDSLPAAYVADLMKRIHPGDNSATKNHHQVQQQAATVAAVVGNTPMLSRKRRRNGLKALPSTQPTNAEEEDAKEALSVSKRPRRACTGYSLRTDSPKRSSEKPNGIIENSKSPSKHSTTDADDDFDENADGSVKLAAWYNEVEALYPSTNSLITDDENEIDSKSRSNSNNPHFQLPSLLRGELREYQIIGVKWLATLYDKGFNGILADEMGLGKTIQTIALLGHLACNRENWGPHLIIVPTSVILNWELEFKKWLPGFSVLTYYGSARERSDKRRGWMRPHSFNVCITSYNIALLDQRQLSRRRWRYIILDEAQAIKNWKSQRWQMISQLRCTNRLLLTGTPIQNSMQELWSLLNFLQPDVFADLQMFVKSFADPLSGMIEGARAFDSKVVSRLHQVMRPFMLRRMKADVEKQLPTKREEVIICKLSKRQQQLYEDFMSRSRTRAALAEGNYMGVINVLMQLRKVCNHPNLFAARPVTSSFVVQDRLLLSLFHSMPSLVMNKLTTNVCDSVSRSLIEAVACRSYLESLSPFDAETISRLSPKNQHHLIKNSSSSADIVPVLRSPQDLLAAFKVYKNGYFYSGYHHSLRRNSTAVSATDAANENENVSNFTVAAKTASSITPLSELVHSVQNVITSKNTCYSRIMMAENARRCTPIAGSAAMIESIMLLSNDRKESNRNYYSFLPIVCRLADLNTNYAGTQCEIMSRSSLPAMAHNTSHNADINNLNYSNLEWAISSAIIYVPPAVTESSLPEPVAQKLSIFIQPPFDLRQCRTKLMRPIISSVAPPMFSLANEVAARCLLQFPETRLIEYDCGKLQRLRTLLHRLRVEGHRALIFTQMTRVLDILEGFLSYHTFKYLRLDGSTKIELRQALMERFNEDARVFCMILSTRAGGVGVNLTGADTVIFYDSDWNPTMDAQAQDRCHRIGQTRNVTIYRLVSQSTIEESILRRATQKRQLNQLAIESGEFRPSSFSVFHKSDLQEIFADPTSTPKGAVNPTASDSVATAVVSSNNDNDAEMITALAHAEDEEDRVAAQRALREVEYCAQRDEYINEAAVDDIDADPDQQQPVGTPAAAPVVNGSTDSGPPSQAAAAAPASSTALNMLIGEIDLGHEARADIATVDNVMSMLRPVERYMVRMLEKTGTGASEYADELQRIENEKQNLMQYPGAAVASNVPLVATTTTNSSVVA